MGSGSVASSRKVSVQVIRTDEQVPFFLERDAHPAPTVAATI
jgi:hypothetical protein